VNKPTVALYFKNAVCTMKCIMSLFMITGNISVSTGATKHSTALSNNSASQHSSTDMVSCCWHSVFTSQVVRNWIGLKKH